MSNTKEPNKEAKQKEVRITNPGVKYNIFGKVQRVFSQLTKSTVNKGDNLFLLSLQLCIQM